MTNPGKCGGPTGLHVLLRLKVTVLRNLLLEAVSESPVKLAASAGFLLLIWFGLFFLFEKVFESLQTTPLEQAVVVPVVFNLFFLALLGLLAFSAAILAYGSLFGGRESAFLLASPIRPLHLVLVKYAESLFFSSWSLILLGIPLMMAMARTYEETWVFYPLFVAFFLFFVPIPGAIGLLLAWMTARMTRRGLRRAMLAAAAAGVAGTVLWALRLVHDSEWIAEDWAGRFFARMQFIETALLPSTWVARGIERALRDEPGEAVGYLAVTLSNTLFLSLVAVWVCSRGFLTAFDLAGTGSGRRLRGRSWTNRGRTGLCELPFFYLPLGLRLIAAKDLRTFLRDPMQWSQLAILLGLMALYLLNLPRFYVDIFETSWGALVPFLNLSAVTLILATFTSRFVFPLVSLEGKQLWLIGLLPLRRERVLAAKFAYALTVTAVAATAITVLAAVSLQMPLAWGLVHVGVTLSVCVGLCGLAAGLGARLPLFEHVSAGRIANGFGGTVNLIASVGLVVICLAGMVLVSARARDLGSHLAPDPVGVLMIIGLMVFAAGVGLAALWVGGRHFRTLEV